MAPIRAGKHALLYIDSEGTCVALYIGNWGKYAWPISRGGENTCGFISTVIQHHSHQPELLLPTTRSTPILLPALNTRTRTCPFHGSNTPDPHLHHCEFLLATLLLSLTFSLALADLWYAGGMKGVALAVV